MKCTFFNEKILYTLLVKLEKYQTHHILKDILKRNNMKKLNENQNQLNCLDNIVKDQIHY